MPTSGANAPNRAVAPAPRAANTPDPAADADCIALIATVSFGNATDNASIILVSVFAPSIPFIADSFQR